jgi:hypothetical protein
MKSPLLFWLLTLAWLAGGSTTAQAQAPSYTADQLKQRIQQAVDSARKAQRDSIRQRQAIRTEILKATQAALDAKNERTHAETLVATVELRQPTKHYALYKPATVARIGPDGKPRHKLGGTEPLLVDSVDKKGRLPSQRMWDEYFVLRQARFYPENGRLLRVYVEGERWRDSTYWMSLPDPKQVANGRQLARLVRTWGTTPHPTDTTYLRLKRIVTGDTVETAATNKDAPRAVLRHKHRLLDGHLILSNNSTSIDLTGSATTGSIDYLWPDHYLGEPQRAVRFYDLVSIVRTAARRLPTDSEAWTLKPDSVTTHRLTAGSGGLGGLLEVALYTDLLSTLNNEDNGLVSTEVASWLPLHQRPFMPNGRWFFGTAVRPFVSVSRLDSRFDTLHLNQNNRIDRPNLMQRAYLRFGLNLNLLTVDNRGPVTAQLNASWVRTLTRVRGAAGTADTVARNVYQNLYGLELLTTVRRQRNFGADLYFTAYYNNAQSRRVIDNTEAQWALRPGALFYYYPFGSPANKLFFRVSNYIFPQERQRDFVQLQVGYSIGLGALLGGGAGAAGSAATGAHLPGQ